MGSAAYTVMLTMNEDSLPEGRVWCRIVLYSIFFDIFIVQPLWIVCVAVYFTFIDILKESDMEQWKLPGDDIIYTSGTMKPSAPPSEAETAVETAAETEGETEGESEAPPRKAHFQ